jgi:DNA sulfur modification protein DndD
MATIIKSISFQNFYNYYGDFEPNTYRFREGVNIVNADNNMGKSKFYNGILWILNNAVYDSDLKRMISDTSSPRLDSNYFKKMVSGKAKAEKTEFDMGVKIEFEENNTQYSVSKIVHCKKNPADWAFIERLDVSETTNGRTIPIQDIEDKKSRIQKIIPVELRNYALLQGESMERLVNLSSRAGLSSTIETLAGISDLINICSTCGDLSKKAKKLSNNKESEVSRNNDKINNLIDERERLEKNKESNLSQIETYKEELSKAQARKDELEALQLNAAKREKFREIQRQLQEQITNWKNKKKEAEKNITSILFSNNIPWLLMDLQDSIELFGEKRDKLNKDLTLQSAAKDPTILLPEGSPDIPSLKRMLETEKCEVCGRPAPKDSEFWEHIKMVMERPRNTENSNSNDFSVFYGNIQKTVGSFLLNIPEIPLEIEKYRDQLTDIDNKISEKQEEYNTAKQEFMSAGGNESESGNTDKKNIDDHSLAERTIGDKKRLIERANEQIKQWNIRLQQIEKELDSINQSTEITQYRNFKDMMCCVETMLLNSKERIFDRILNSLEVKANQKYSELTAGNQVAGGRLCFKKQEDNTIQVSIRNINDNELTGLGTGFQRMKQLSIVMAIISSRIGNQHFDYPFISDAPFSEFGDNFIYNFFQIAPQVFTQSIILIKDLYDPNTNNYLNDKGNKILEKMNSGEIDGTFYVNIVEEKADATNLKTKIKRYYPD